MNYPAQENLLRPKLYSYFRSSASYRVRIALNLKKVVYDNVYINLRSGEQSLAEFKVINPQGFVPVLQIGEKALSQSLAIIDYLENIYPQPAIYPNSAIDRAKVLELSHMVAIDIHPLNNLRVLKYLTNELKTDEDSNLRWYRHWLNEGFSAFAQRLQHNRQGGQFCYGDVVTLADICLVPQIYNALRYGFDMSGYKSLMRIYENCLTIQAFEKAQPELQDDAV